MKSLVMLLATAIATVATIAASQEASPTPPATPAATETAKSVTTSGEVVRYDAGKTIVIRQSDDRVVTYALAPAITVPPDVAVGRRVTIFAEPAADGVVRVTRLTTIGPDATPAVGSSPPAAYTRETEKTEETRTVTVTGEALPTGLATGKTVVIRTITRPGAIRPLVRKVTYSTTTTTKKKKGIVLSGSVLSSGGRLPATDRLSWTKFRARGSASS
jgi:hypothetical protein